MSDTVIIIGTLTTHQIPSPFNEIEQNDFVVDISRTYLHLVPLSFQAQDDFTFP